MLTLMGEHDKYEGLHTPWAALTTHASFTGSPLRNALPGRQTDLRGNT
jgi:hypothetical protein